MITKRRIFYASLASAAAFLIVLIVGSYLEAQVQHLHADGRPDNAPIRAIGVLIMISPVLFVLITGLAFFSALVLQRLNQLKPTVIACIIVLVSAGLGFVMVLDRSFGWRDALYYFVGFSALTLATLTPSMLTWWWVATRK